MAIDWMKHFPIYTNRVFSTHLLWNFIFIKTPFIVGFLFALIGLAFLVSKLVLGYVRKFSVIHIVQDLVFEKLFNSLTLSLVKNGIIST